MSHGRAGTHLVDPSSIVPETLGWRWNKAMRALATVMSSARSAFGRCAIRSMIASFDRSALLG